MTRRCPRLGSGSIYKAPGRSLLPAEDRPHPRRRIPAPGSKEPTIRPVLVVRVPQRQADARVPLQKKVPGMEGSAEDPADSGPRATKRGKDQFKALQTRGSARFPSNNERVPPAEEEDESPRFTTFPESESEAEGMGNGAEGWAPWTGVPIRTCAHFGPRGCTFGGR